MLGNKLWEGGSSNGGCYMFLITSVKEHTRVSLILSSLKVEVMELQ